MKKFIWIAGFVLALGLPTLAQQQPAEYNLKVTPAEVEVLGKALGKLPYDDVAPVIFKLKEQINNQQIKQVETPAPKPKE